MRVKALFLENDSPDGDPFQATRGTFPAAMAKHRVAVAKRAAWRRLVSASVADENTLHSERHFLPHVAEARGEDAVELGRWSGSTAQDADLVPVMRARPALPPAPGGRHARALRAGGQGDARARDHRAADGGGAQGAGGRPLAPPSPCRAAGTSSGRPPARLHGCPPPPPPPPEEGCTSRGRLWWPTQPEGVKLVVGGSGSPRSPKGPS